MKIYLLLLLIISNITNAQVTIQYDCSKLKAPFKVNFENYIATIEMNNWVQKVPYLEGHVNQQGVWFSVYQNSEIRVVTTYPIDNYVSVKVNGGSEISGGNCFKK